MPPAYCTNCGAAVSPNAIACPECGADKETGWNEDAHAQGLDLPEEDFDYDEFIEREFDEDKLEIIPLSDPTVAKQNDTLQFRVLLDNNPLANVQLAALGRQADKITDIHTTTGKNGVASLKLPHTGEWLVRLVYLRRCSQKDVEADWESFWAAMTFEAPGRK